VVSTSRVIARKGLDYLVKGFIPLARKHSDAKLLLAGGGDQLKEELQALVEKEGLERQVEFVGNIERDKIADFYRRGDVFALPSLNEGMSNSLLEAMASGLAVVATETGGTKELVDEDNGIIVKKRSTQSIQVALEGLYQNPEKLVTMKQASRKKAEGMSWKIVAEEYQELYRRLSKK
jgi:glycosyltransferase involved in cell wall biosynthesis